ncbi:MAG TPA: phenylalanine--tRNA ligase subunit alpha [Actinomycetota bacterium]|nr:phenylalanine--tRNA ligase subunit alpha [Actinomycetota bacterium]
MDPNEARSIADAELERGLRSFAEADSIDELEAAKTAILGRKSRLSDVQRSIGSVSRDERGELGKRVNEVFADLRSAHDARRTELELATGAEILDADAVDVTLPGRRPRPGSLHPLTLVEQRMVQIFTRMGYRVAEGPEVEDEWHNFEALNIPADHPARTLKDSLYVDVDALLLRTETSAVQIRTMQSQEPPVYVVAPGRVYRREAHDATHSSVFHQLEGLAVGDGITFADLKGTLHAFAKEMFGSDVRVRMKPDYFPFVEPGCDLAVSCFVCGGTGCSVCGNGWLELLGAGMVHPKVLENGGYDAERYTGFAFGIGIERVAMLLYGVNDLRLFTEGDVRFLQQFEGAA